MSKFNINVKSGEMITLEKGIMGDNFFLYFKDNNFYLKHDHIRCFKFTLKRAKNTLGIKDTTQLLRMFIDYIKNINLEKKNENLFYLVICYQLAGFTNFISNNKIKLKEINNYLLITNTDSKDEIIKKQNEKIILLLNKIEEFEKKYSEPTTDDELIITIK